MNSQEDFIIDKPYTLLPKDKEAISKVRGKGLSTKSWSDKELDGFKENIRDYLREKQKGRCAFCRMKLHEENATAEVEHVVNKGSRLDWMFLPQNLCIACSVCNSYKGTKEVLVNKNIEDYPKDGRGFKIIHPMYDRYSDHIELVGGILYRGKTPKGCFTIDTCHLYRVDLAKERVCQRIKEGKGEIMAGIINLLSKSEEYVDDNMKFIQYVCDIVKKYKQKNVNEDNK